MRVAAQRDRNSIEDPEIVREFLLESNENARSLERDIAELERCPNDPSILASIFRAVHTVKGTCGFLGFTRLESVAHETEELLSQIRSTKRAPSPRQIFQILDATNTVVGLLRQIADTATDTDGRRPTLWTKLPLLVDHLSHSLGKQVHLEMDVNTELDRFILDAIKDPLTHLVRNACDHGIEPPDDRLRSGKSAHGTLQLRAYRDRGYVHIEISDDGAGMTTDVLELVFLPGFSTAKKVTKVSGRGVGMDVVKSNIERIGGSVAIATRPGRGTCVKMKLPLPQYAEGACVCAPENYLYLQDFIYQESGIVLEAGKHRLLETRLLGLAREHGVTTLNDLCSLLRASHDAPLRQKVVDAMTTNETYFFREPEHYDVLGSILVPELFQSRRPLRFWSAASSSGQEAYSLAMVLLDIGLTSNNVEILGTDLCSRVLDRARAGIFSRLEMTRGLPASYAAKYFDPIGPQWQVRAELKRMVRFQPFDLRAPMDSLGSFDVVFCRNVLIYFDLATKLKIIDHIHSTLIPGGYLFLGSAEAALPLSDRFQRKSIAGTTVFVAQ